METIWQLFFPHKMENSTQLQRFFHICIYSYSHILKLVELNKMEILSYAIHIMHIHSSLHIDNFIRSIIMGFKGTRYLYKIWFVHLCFICYKISFFWSIYFQSLNCWCSFADQVTWAFNVISMGKLYFYDVINNKDFFVGDFTNLAGISFFIYISFISQRSYGARF